MPKANCEPEEEDAEQGEEDGPFYYVCGLARLSHDFVSDADYVGISPCACIGFAQREAGSNREYIQRIPCHKDIPSPFHLGSQRTPASPKSSCLSLTQLKYKRSMFDLQFS
jgi:hypothetical protein